ncbi:glycoside hydrolase family 17 protein [Cadophora sp. DSE1049]|nr:glycoside hydrolase family 17 protein [Cadophora sp. DSE1049]
MHASLIALAASLSVASAVTRGFNYGAVTREGAMKNEAAFTAEFKAAKGLANTDGAFSSARLYTMIQSGTDNSPISAIPAAIATDTKLFLGLWASAGQTIIDNEIAALTSAIEQYGEEFTSRVNGISVGSEDLYRISPTGLKNDPTGVGAQPSQIVSYIQQVRKALAGTSLSGVAVGHVDTWDVWRNGSNSAVIDEADFLGMNTFPYFQVTEDNSIENAPTLFNAAYDITTAAAKGKPVIVTETGWPVAGKDAESGHPSVANARSYYEAVGCNTLFGKVDTYWYTLVDANTAVDSQPQFGVVGTTVSSKSLFDLKCDAPKSTSSSASKTATSTSASGSATGSASGSVTGSASSSPTGTTLVQVNTSGAAASGTGSGSGSGSGTGASATTGTATDPSSTSTIVTTTNAASQMKASSFIGLVGAAAALIAFA